MSLTIHYAPVDLTFRGFGPADDFSFSIVEAGGGSGGSTTEQLVTPDMYANVTVFASADNNFRILVSDSPDRPGHWFGNLSTAGCTVDTEGNVALKFPDGDGKVATVEIVGATGARRYSRLMFRSGGSQHIATSRYVAGTLGQHIIDQVKGLIAGKSNPAMTDGGVGTGLLDRISAWDPATGSVSLNANCFCHGLEASGVPAVMGTDENGDGGSLIYVPGQSNNTTSAALITSRHLLSGHTGSPTLPMLFRGNDGSTHVRKVVSSATFSGNDHAGHFLGYLDDDLPNTVMPFRMMPDGWQVRYMPGLAYIYGNPHDSAVYYAARLPMILKARRGPFPLNGDLFKLANWGLSRVPGGIAGDPTGGLADLGIDTIWAPQIIAGDSSSPAFFPINGELVLAFMLSTADGTGDIQPTPGYFSSSLGKTLQQACDSLAGSSMRQIQTVDLSAFTSFP